MTAEDLAAFKSELIKDVVAAVRNEMRKEAKALLTIPETARKYRMRDDDVRQAAKDGVVKSRKTKRSGFNTYLIDAVDAERLWGAQ